MTELPDSIWNFEDGSKGCTGDLDCEADVHMHGCFASPASWDGDELVRWAERYGHPEGWVKRAQAAHMRSERLVAILVRLRRVYTPHGVGHWLFNSHAKLDGAIPYDLIVAGRLGEVEAVLPPLDQVAT